MLLPEEMEIQRQLCSRLPHEKFLSKSHYISGVEQMSGQQLPSAEEQIPSVEEIFQSLEGHPPEEQMPALAAIMQAMLGQMSEMEKRQEEYYQRVDDLYKEIYDPLKKGYQEKVRGQGLESLKGKYGSLFDPILEPLKGFGIEDPYSTLYDMLEQMKKDGTYNEADEGKYIGDQHADAMKHITAVRGTPPAEEVAETPAPEAEVEVEIKKEEKPAEKKPEEKPKSLAQKKRSMRDGY